MRFVAHVKFDGISDDLTAPNTPWIYYGVSLSVTQTSSVSHRQRRGLMLELEPPICESYTQIWFSERSHRVVSGPEYHTQITVLSRCVSRSRYPRFNPTMGVYGCYP